jgi:hypothetical protein
MSADLTRRPTQRYPRLVAESSERQPPRSRRHASRYNLVRDDAPGRTDLLGNSAESKLCAEPKPANAAEKTLPHRRPGSHGALAAATGSGAPEAEARMWAGCAGREASSFVEAVEMSLSGVLRAGFTRRGGSVSFVARQP